MVFAVDAQGDNWLIKLEVMVKMAALSCARVLEESSQPLKQMSFQGRWTTLVRNECRADKTSLNNLFPGDFPLQKASVK